jgi:hypothetical protein
MVKLVLFLELSHSAYLYGIQGSNFTLTSGAGVNHADYLKLKSRGDHVSEYFSVVLSELKSFFLGLLWGLVDSFYVNSDTSRIVRVGGVVPEQETHLLHATEVIHPWFNESEDVFLASHRQIIDVSIFLALKLLGEGHIIAF